MAIYQVNGYWYDSDGRYQNMTEQELSDLLAELDKKDESDWCDNLSDSLCCDDCGYPEILEELRNRAKWSNSDTTDKKD